MNRYSDSELIEKALSGDRTGYAGLVDRHKAYAFSIALRLVKKREDAEEIAQDSFLKAFRSLEKFRMESKFSTWLYRIVYTTALNYLRKNGVNTLEIDETLSAQLADPDADSAGLLDQKIKKKYLNIALGRLRSDDALVLQLFYIAENNLEEIASIMELETNTVKIRLHRARPRLRACLEELMHEESIEL